MTAPFVFTGGVEVSERCLRALGDAGYVPALAVGYPPSLAARSGYRPLREAALRYGCPLIETEDVNAPEVVERIRLTGAVLHLVIGWSQLVGRNLLWLPRHGTVGVHPTRLPEGRGRAPIPWTLIRGLKRSAVTLLFLDEDVDSGDIIDQEEFEVEAEDDASTLYQKIARLHERLLLRHIEAMLAGKAPRRRQDDSQATYWPRRRPDDGRIDWTRPAGEVYNWVRGLTHPYPGAFTTFGGKTLFVWKASPPLPGRGVTAAPGTVAGLGPEGVWVACGDGEVLLKRLQFEGGREAEAHVVAGESGIARGARLGG